MLKIILSLVALARVSGDWHVKNVVTIPWRFEEQKVTATDAAKITYTGFHDVVTFKSKADELTNVYSTYDGYVGHCYLGGFFTAAPWLHYYDEYFFVNAQVRVSRGVCLTAARGLVLLW